MSSKHHITSVCTEANDISHRNVLVFETLENSVVDGISFSIRHSNEVHKNQTYPEIEFIKICREYSHLTLSGIVRCFIDDYGKLSTFQYVDVFFHVIKSKCLPHSVCCLLFTQSNSLECFISWERTFEKGYTISSDSESGRLFSAKKLHSFISIFDTESVDVVGRQNVWILDWDLPTSCNLFFASWCDLHSICLTMACTFPQRNVHLARSTVRHIFVAVFLLLQEILETKGLKAIHH